MGMMNVEVPSWMREIKAEQDAERLRATLQAKDEALMKALMETDAPERIWKRLTGVLTTLAPISEKTIGVRVTVSDISSAIEPAVQVTAGMVGIGRIGELRSLYTNVFFSRDEYRIRCLGQMEDEGMYFQFCTVNNSLSLCSGNKPITPEDAASEIIRRLVSAFRSCR